MLNLHDCTQVSEANILRRQVLRLICLAVFKKSRSIRCSQCDLKTPFLETINKCALQKFISAFISFNIDFSAYCATPSLDSEKTMKVGQN